MVEESGLPPTAASPGGKNMEVTDLKEQVRCPDRRAGFDIDPSSDHKTNCLPGARNGSRE